MKPFEARFPGKCSLECGTKIEPKVLVRYDHSALIHDECPLTDDVTDKPLTDACPVCWMTLCWCD